jgi:sigma-B regulation protein RsbU (phosphoserine phosphatase)
MRRSSFRKPLLATLATLFAAATVLYTALWIYNTRWQVPVELGFDNQYVEAEHCELVQSVHKGSAAESAGLRAGDRIIAIDGRRIANSFSISDVWAAHHPGDAVDLTIQRANVPAPFVIKALFRAPRPFPEEGRVGRDIGRDIFNTYPVGFLVVGLAVLFLRLEDPNAWLLALMFAGFIATPGTINSFAGLNASLRSFALAYRAFFGNMVTPLFYFFFAVFPTRSPLDRRLPWLKWIALVVASYFPLMHVLGRPPGGPHILVLSFFYGLLALGFVSLIWNAFSAPNAEARRKIRVILWGTVVGVVPAVLVLGSNDFFGVHVPPLFFLAVIVLLWVFPLSFAYAVVMHQVLEIPVLLRMSARYLLVQRGFTILLALLGVVVVWVFALSIPHYLEPLTRAALPGGLALGTAFGSLLLWTGTRVHKRVGEKIDHAFFRSAYDAHMILQDLAEKTRTATDRQELAALLDHHLNQALQPSSLAIYLETRDHLISAFRGDVPPDIQTISITPAIIAELARRGRLERYPGIPSTWEVPAESSSNTIESFLFDLLQPDCLVPLLGRDSRPVGLLVLGARLSEEPYSSDDKRLLASVASQAGVALESIRLGEKIAERIEAERRIAQEMDYAKQVQARLFPQKLPSMKTLDYAGGCIQARQVGGDYYDFLELRPGRLALVLADIAGKGISGALLMANLQANLRSQYAVALDDLPRLLKSVNQLFYENSSDSSYATLFFADYDDSTLRLRYVNCGHLPPLLLRADGQLERLAATNTVLGLFEKWECSVAEVQLAAGDTLVLYTDGVTEAENAQEEQFGEARLVETMLAHRHLPVRILRDTIVKTAQEFSDGIQGDDITLVVARCKVQEGGSLLINRH